MAEKTTYRRAIAETLRRRNEIDEQEPRALVGWVLISEWMGDDGRKWLHKNSSDASDEKDLTEWTEKGLLHEGLFGSWK